MVQQPTRKPKLVLVVCHGNKFRSPLAEAIIAREIGPENVASRGFGLEGCRAAAKVRRYAARLGYDLENHRSCKVSAEDYEMAKIVLYMDSGNYKRIPPEVNAVCLGQYAGVSRIPDPAFLPKGPQTDEVLDLVVRAAKAFSVEWLAQQKPPAKSCSAEGICTVASCS